MDGGAPMVQPHTRRRGARLSLLVAVAIGVGFAGLLGVRVKQAVAKRGAVATERAVAAESQKQKDPDRTVRPVTTKWIPRVDVTGTLKPWRDADVGFETSGRLVRISVAIGDRVSEGQVLALLDGSRAAAQVGQADAQVHARRGQPRARARQPAANRGARRVEGDPRGAGGAGPAAGGAREGAARRRRARAPSSRRAAPASTASSRPFAGIVTRAPTGIGGVVNPGVPLIHVEDTSRFRLSVTVGEEDVPLITVGAPVKVVYRERSADGQVIRGRAFARPGDASCAGRDRGAERQGRPAPRLGLRPRAHPRQAARPRRFVSRRSRVGPGSQDEVVKVEAGRARQIVEALVRRGRGRLARRPARSQRDRRDPPARRASISATASRSTRGSKDRADEHLGDRDQAPGLHRHGDGGAPGPRLHGLLAPRHAICSPTCRSRSSSSPSPTPARPRRGRAARHEAARRRGRRRSTASIACARSRARARRRLVMLFKLGVDVAGRGDRGARARLAGALQAAGRDQGADRSALRRRRRAGPHLHAARRRLARRELRQYARRRDQARARAGRRRRRRST